MSTFIMNRFGHFLATWVLIEFLKFPNLPLFPDHDEKANQSLFTGSFRSPYQIIFVCSSNKNVVIRVEQLDHHSIYLTYQSINTLLAHQVVRL